MIHNGAHWIYLFNLGLGLIGFTWLVVRSYGRWNEYPSEIQKLLIVTMAFIFALLETSGEEFLLDLPVSANAFVIFFVKGFLLYVLWTTRTTLYRTGTRHTDNEDKLDVNRDYQDKITRENEK